MPDAFSLFFDCGAKLLNVPQIFDNFDPAGCQIVESFSPIRQFRSNLVSNCRIYLTYSTALATTLSIITPASYLSLAFSY